MDDIDRLAINNRRKVVGVACTGLALFPDWVNAHAARKVVLHRNRIDIDRSLVQLGFDPLDLRWDAALDQINGARHYSYDRLFNQSYAQEIYEYLTGLPFDPQRWGALVKMNVQPQFDRISIDRVATQRLLKRMQGVSIP